MPRPQKSRFVCRLPDECRFAPDGKNAGDTVVMTVDEYETIRLIDHENATQEECGAQMNVARTTVQGIYDSARKKLADVLVNGKRLTISGGEYRLCGDYRECCGKGCAKACHREGCGRGRSAESCPRTGK